MAASAPAHGRLHARARIENRLAGGRYVLTCALFSGPEGANLLAAPPRPLSFEVGGEESGGLVSFDHEVSFESRGEAVPNR
jgi:hypothetical protein